MVCKDENNHESVAFISARALQSLLRVSVVPSLRNVCFIGLSLLYLLLCYYYQYFVRWHTLILTRESSLVLRQKVESQNKCFKKTKHAKFSEKRTFLTTRYAHARFSENLTCFVFLKHRFWDSLICLITNKLGWFFYLLHSPGKKPGEKSVDSTKSRLGKKTSWK